MVAVPFPPKPLPPPFPGLDNFYKMGFRFGLEELKFMKSV
jgi:hypothetical protein